MLEVLLSYDATNAPCEVYAVYCFKQTALFKKVAFNFKHTNWALQQIVGTISLKNIITICMAKKGITKVMARIKQNCD